MTFFHLRCTIPWVYLHSTTIKNFNQNIYWFWYTVLIEICTIKHASLYLYIYCHSASACSFQLHIVSCYIENVCWFIYLVNIYTYLYLYTPQNIQYKLHAQYYASLFIYLLLIMVRHSSGVHLLPKPLFIYVDNSTKQINMMIACEVICFWL